MSSVLSELVLIAAVCFNAVLSVINGHVVALARAHVILAEIAVYAGALAIIVFKADRKMWPWFLLTLFIILMGLLVSLASGELNAKYIRDVLVIPVFILLGMTYRSDTFIRPFFILHTTIFVVAVLEAISPDSFADLFKVLDYYVNTRDFSANAFWNADSNLFLSATRPGDAIFQLRQLAPVSSIFWSRCRSEIIALLLLYSSWSAGHEMTIAARCYFIGSTLFLLVGSDGRLATTSIIIVLLAVPFLQNISCRWSALYLPIILLLAAVYVWTFYTGEGYDNFSGRVAGTIEALSQIDVVGLLGLSATTAENNAGQWHRVLYTIAVPGRRGRHLARRLPFCARPNVADLRSCHRNIHSS